jgi:hypothetical protein
MLNIYLPSLKTFLTTFAFCALLYSGSLRADGGMYPISMIDSAPLKKAGLKMNTNEIYNPNGKGLMQAVVQIGGCTGSFVSGKGLIITNHHCAFGSLSPYSSAENNLMEKGYLAADGSKELPMKGLTVKIMESHWDVSSQVLKGTQQLSDPVEIRNLILKNMDAIRQGEQLKYPKLLIDISEMLPGKSYILVRYKTLKDIRIVYVPARNIGEFGGESDNWVWPRHNADFSFVRAYVNKDGEGVPFDSANVPYEPKEYLNINSSGVNEGDFVMVLGYPGRTFRHQPADFLKFHEDFLLPFISELYEWQINTMQKLGENNPAYKVRMTSRIKSLANVMKNYQGKLKTVKKLDLFDKKKQEEKDILARLQNRPALQKEFARILNRYDSLYGMVEENYTKYLWLSRTTTEIAMLRMAHIVDDYNTKYASKKSSPTALAALTAQTKSQLREYYKGISMEYDSLYLKKMLWDALQYKDGNKVAALDKAKVPQDYAAFSHWFTDKYQHSRLLDSNFVYQAMDKKPKKLLKLEDPFLIMAHDFYPEQLMLDSIQTNYKIRLDNMLSRYVDIKMAASEQLFIPDANSTLRLTYGYLKGYSPADAVYYKPQTTLQGMLDKNGQSEDYVMNDDIGARLEKFVNEKKTPVGMLYNTDTSGGNSGSPILNRYGQLVGVNFDRSYEATVNDYAWDDAYSRSIGVDIRFVLWVTGKVAKADYLINEMFIEQ